MRLFVTHTGQLRQGAVLHNPSTSMTTMPLLTCDASLCASELRNRPLQIFPLPSAELQLTASSARDCPPPPHPHPSLLTLWHPLSTPTALLHIARHCPHFFALCKFHPPASSHHQLHTVHVHRSRLLETPSALPCPQPSPQSHGFVDAVAAPHPHKCMLVADALYCAQDHLTRHASEASHSSNWSTSLHKFLL